MNRLQLLSNRKAQLDLISCLKLQSTHTLHTFSSHYSFITQSSLTPPRNYIALKHSGFIVRFTYQLKQQTYYMLHTQDLPYCEMINTRNTAPVTSWQPNGPHTTLEYSNHDVRHYFETSAFIHTGCDNCVSPLSQVVWTPLELACLTHTTSY